MDDGEKQLTKKEKRQLAREQRMQEENLKKKGSTVARFFWWGVGIVLIVAGFWYLKSLTETPATSLAIAAPGQKIEHDNVTGATESAKLLVEYSDLQCPACAAYHPIVKQLLSEHGNEFTFIYRHFPLRQIHKNAQLAGQAAEAAAKQGKFWEMQDKLFTNQKDWAEKGNAEEFFVDYAEEFGLNTDQFKTDLHSQDAKDKVNADYASGIQARISSTPTFFLNGEKVDMTSVKSYEDFKNKILSQ